MRNPDEPLILIEIWPDGARMKANDLSADDLKRVVFELEHFKFRIMADFINQSPTIDLKKLKKN